MNKIRFTACIIGLFSLLAAWLLIGQTGILRSSAQESPAADLFGLGPDQADVAIPASPTILRGRTVIVNRELLKQVDGFPGANSSAGNLLTLNLFDDASFKAVFDHLEYQSPERFTWVGRLDGIEMSLVTLVVHGDIVVGNISMPSACYQVGYIAADAAMGSSVQVVYQIDQSAYPPEAAPLIPGEDAADVEPVQSDPAIAAPSMPSDDGSIIDVLVLYTSAAAAKVGGVSAMEATIDLAISESNTGYSNSGITQRLRLVHQQQTSYTELGGYSLSTDLNRLTSPGDGFLDEAHTLRETYKADVVNLLIGQGPGAPYCGMAWLMSYVSPSFEDSAFSVVEVDCATGYYSFAHELGHNMGALHDWYVDDGVYPYEYAHAYAYVPGRWRTIMAYNNQCSDAGVNCTRLPYWSNPNVLYNGVPMGVPQGQYQPADNHQTLNNTAYTVANFRIGLSEPTPTPTQTPPPTPTPTSTPKGKIVMPLYLKYITKTPGLDTPTPTPTIASPASVMLPNGDFELGQVTWFEYSTNGFALILSDLQFPIGISPHGGGWGVWLGGAPDEVSYIEQFVNIPVDHLYLGYWRWIDSEETSCGADVSQVLINSNLVDSTDLCVTTNTGGWMQYSVDLSAFAGQTVLLQMRVETNALLNSNLFVDDIWLFTTPPVLQFRLDNTLPSLALEKTGRLTPNE